MQLCVVMKAIVCMDPVFKNHPFYYEGSLSDGIRDLASLAIVMKEEKRFILDMARSELMQIQEQGNMQEEEGGVVRSCAMLPVGLESLVPSGLVLWAGVPLGPTYSCWVSL